MPVLPEPQPLALDNLLRARADALRGKDQPPTTRDYWQRRRTALRQAMFTAMGSFPAKPCALEPRVIGVLQRNGYRIEKVIFQSQPDMWVTASLYIPAKADKSPAVLGVHGHWAGARRDPVVQARCLGLVKLGFVVLMVDAFGSGERYTAPARGTYHGALYGATLWPTGQTLLGVQVYDNQRAIDYLRSRPEVDGNRIGVTGASGGGNQSMYAGALDERIAAVVPVCSVGNYRAYLRAACCVCEVLPGALTFTEEGDVLGLVAPRALMVISATRDAFQFSIPEARRSLAQARPIFELLDAGDKLRHTTFESPHAYNQPMREAMYGWMTRWLKNEGKGEPIAEPAHEVDSWEDLACFPDGNRPAGFLLPPTFAQRVGQELVRRADATRPGHIEEWESTAATKRTHLRRQVFGDFPATPKPEAKLGKPSDAGQVRTLPVIVHPEPNMPVPGLLQTRRGNEKAQPVCVLLHIEGKEQALKHPVAAALLERNISVAAFDLRGTGETRVTNDAVQTVPDHNSAEHAVWVGRPLLGQWVFDVQCWLDWLGTQPGLDRRRLAVVGIGQAGLVALCASALLDDRISAAGTLGTWTTLVTSEPYPAGTRMGLLAPGLLQVGDIPHLAALSAPRRLYLAEGVNLAGDLLTEKDLRNALAFPQQVYRVHKADNAITVAARYRVEELVRAFGW